MEILYKKRKIIDITNIVDLENFIIQNNFFKLFKKFPKEYNSLISGEIKKTEKLNFKEVRKWYRNIVNYPESVYDRNFLFSMGWENDEIENFIKNKQKENSKKLAIKKNNYPELYYDKSPKRVEYWMKKGYTMNESKKIISDQQKTFSKEICLKKFGEIKGLEIFNNRQNKWIQSLHNNNNINDINKKKNNYLYGIKTTDELIRSTSFLSKTKEVIVNCINCENPKEFVKCVLDKIDVKTLSDIIPFINSSIISAHYNIDRKEIKKYFFDFISDKLKTGLYGTPIYHNGNRFKSIKEYKISLLFESKNINYIYELSYPESNFKCDFYLPDYDLYIEYFGILDGKRIDKLDEKQLKYYDKMIKKILFCDENKIKLIYDTEFTKLYNTLLNTI